MVLSGIATVIQVQRQTGFWAKEMRNLFPQMGEGRMLILYVILAVVTGLFIQYTSLGLRKFWKVKGEAVKRIFIE